MDRKIGVLDTGVGGLSVMTGIQKLLPNENILYFGDSKNCPYGNRPKEEILALTIDMLKFMEKSNVKLVAIACNTISTLINDYKNKFSFPIVDIINPTVDHILKMKIDSVGILGTEFTIKSKVYENLLVEKNKSIEIITEGSKTLASLVDKGDFDSNIVKDTIKYHIKNMQNKGDLYNIVLACTHFPIVENLFLEIAPELNYINPGFQQAKAIKEYLQSNNLLNEETSGSLEVYTSGETEIYKVIIERLGLKNLIGINKLELN